MFKIAGVAQLLHVSCWRILVAVTIYNTRVTRVLQACVEFLSLKDAENFENVKDIMLLYIKVMLCTVFVSFA